MSRVVFIVSVLLAAVELAVLATVLPAEVPLHFGAELAADRYGSRAEFLWVAGGTTTGVAALFAGLAALMPRIPLAHLNVPHADFWKTPEREPELRRRVTADALHVGTATLLLLGGVFAFVGHAAVTGADRLPAAALVLVGTYTVGMLAWVGWLLARRYRPPGPQR